VVVLVSVRRGRATTARELFGHGVGCVGTARVQSLAVEANVPDLGTAQLLTECQDAVSAMSRRTIPELASESDVTNCHCL